ncbi:hypothetical protein RRG08_048612 [Elysia crispata]|uniref:AMP-dependent synthetase/ligase domain-containing protein n=1 Tax=Elysia crispata TaxID=231223 RepID=A0AAE1DWC5_9GAST|nr:hypothetical protein RRG08_048612 [Elysia crispata]
MQTSRKPRSLSRSCTHLHRAIDIYIYKLCMRRFAHILREKGVKHGQSVCVSLHTSVELAVAFYGAMLAGAKAVSCEVIMDKAQVFHHCINKYAELFCLDHGFRT